MENVNNLMEECFCLRYELNALAEITLKNESERWIPGFINKITEVSHEARYELASKYANDKTILDIACGVGRGSNMLATHGQAKSVTGCDIQEDAIRYAKHRNSHKNIEFEVQNAELYSRKDFYDMVVSFETIEHLRNYKAFLDNIKVSLTSKGILIVSTPISSKRFDNNPGNPYHVQEWGFKEFQTVVSEYLEVKEVFIQLYQNAFLNDQYESEKLRKKNMKENVKKVVRKIRGRNENVELPYNDWKSETNYAKIEKFNNQYNIDNLGSKYIGYQILVCQKS